MRAYTMCLALFLSPAVFSAQERAPGGQIYGELLPMVGLQGVRLEVRGLEGGIWNVPGVVGHPESNADPETDATGLSRAENEKLAEAIFTDATEALQTHGIPFLKGEESSTETRPVLVVRLERYRPTEKDGFATRVEVSLFEAARLVKDPNRIVWSSTWSVIGLGFASRPTLASVLRQSARGYVNEFIGLYLRAHAP